MLGKILSRIGMNSIKVKTIVSESNIERGKETQGEVHIFGGIIEQKISKIYIHIDSEFHKDEDEMTEFRKITEPILEIKISDPIIVKAHEEKVVSFSFILPYYTPVTFGEQKVIIKTEVDINFINRPVEDHDFVVSDPLLNDILKFLNKRGFEHSIKSGLCRQKKLGDNNPSHLLQVFSLMNNQGVTIYFVGNEKDYNIFIYKQERVIHCPIIREKDVNEQLAKLNQYL